jgi:hypothetical protein
MLRIEPPYPVDIEAEAWLLAAGGGGAAVSAKARELNANNAGTTPAKTSSRMIIPFGLGGCLPQMAAKQK